MRLSMSFMLTSKWWENNLKTSCGFIPSWKQDNFSGCHPIHDKILCWPPTRRNSLAVQPCFKEYNGVLYSVEGKNSRFLGQKFVNICSSLHRTRWILLFSNDVYIETFFVEIFRILIVIQIEFFVFLQCECSDFISFKTKLYSWDDDEV